MESFTYDSLARKQDQAVLKQNEESMNELLDCLEGKQKIVKTMDDHGALDLHKSKSYIVDLIDRALSKELGTVPREQLVSVILPIRYKHSFIPFHRFSSDFSRFDTKQSSGGDKQAPTIHTKRIIVLRSHGRFDRLDHFERVSAPYRWF